MVHDSADPGRSVSCAELAAGQRIARRLGRKAVLESVADAVGARVFRMPMTAARVREAIREAAAAKA